METYMSVKHAWITAIASIVLVGPAVGIAHAQSASRQANAPAYYIAEFELTDREGLRPYAEQVESTFAPFSGRYVARGGQMDRLEGDPPNNRMVIIAFDSLDQARAWYHSAEYAKICPIGQRSGQTNAYILEGIQK